MDFIKNILSEIYSNNDMQRIIAGSNVKRKTTLRINTLKADIQTVLSEINSLGVKYNTVPFSNTALIIEDGAEIIKNSSLFLNGNIYLQSLSSQLPPIILSPNENSDILDMTAAPGGKTTQIAAITNNKCNITACEMHANRAQRLKFNIEKQGVTCANVMVTDARKLESYFSFDKILLDAPCSGSGTFDLTNPKTYSGFTNTLIKKSMSAQTALLDKAISVLKVGGELVYSTCSVLPKENDEIVKKVLSKHNCEIVPIDNEIRKNLPLLPCSLKDAICVCPTDEYEGFFVAKIKKTGN